LRKSYRMFVDSLTSLRRTLDFTVVVTYLNRQIN
jgi:hypothetical protein